MSTATPYDQLLRQIPESIRAEVRFSDHTYLPLHVLHEGPGSAIDIRPAEDVARRALVLRTLVRAAFTDGHRPRAIVLLKRQGLWDATTPKERRFFEGDADRQATIDATWRGEALAVLLWCLGCLDRLEPPTHPYDFDDLERICPSPRESTTFIRDAKL